MSRKDSGGPRRLPSLRMSATQNASVKRFGASQVSFVSSRSNLNLASSRQHSRSNLLSSSRRSMLALEKQQQEKDKDRAPAVQIIDQDGIDWTPRDIVQVDPAQLKRNMSLYGDASLSTPSESLFEQSLYGGAAASFAQPFSRSVLESDTSSLGSGSLDELSAPSSLTNITTVDADVDVERAREDAEIPLTQEDLDKVVDVLLSETETIWLLDIPGTAVGLDSEEAKSVQERNEKYEELCKNREGNDRYTQRGMQTFNNALKDKNVLAAAIDRHEAGVTATTWDMYDTYEAERENEMAVAGAEADGLDDDAVLERPASMTSRQMRTVSTTGTEATTLRTPSAIGSSISESRTSFFTSVLSSETASMRGGVLLRQSQPQATPDENGALELPLDPILKSDALLMSLRLVEKVVIMNVYQSQQAKYRGLPVIGEPKPTPQPSSRAASQRPIDKPVLDRLWTYCCPLTANRCVCAMGWNKSNKDILAVGYGQFEYTDQKGGLVCCWSIKNPEYPDRVYTTDRGVTALDFSATNPNLLAVGMFDGTIAVYNVRKTDSTPVIDSSKTEGSHSSPIWKLKWIEREKASGDETSEVLVSIATDGRVVQWSIRKGFECYDLMKMKRTTKKGRKGGGGGGGSGGGGTAGSGGAGSEGARAKQSEALIARYANGQTFDFTPHDTNIYLAGTEEGHIHKCSCSYNEQYLETYFGHMGPVYCIQWSPFVADAFLSCSADWTVRLWHQDCTKPAATFVSSNKAIFDVRWSPTFPSVFGAVSEGKVEIWDLTKDVLDPLIVFEPATHCLQTSMLFAENANALLIGDSHGQVTVYQLANMSSTSEDEQIDAVRKLILPTTDLA